MSPAKAVQIGRRIWVGRSCKKKPIRKKKPRKGHPQCFGESRGLSGR